MKIGMQTWGSEGDINPFIALASALSKAGHEVTLAITSTVRKDYKTISNKYGFNLGTVDHIGSDEKHLAKILNRIETTYNLLAQMKLVFKEMFEPCVPSMFKTAQYLCEQNEIIIGHFIHHPIQAASEKAGRPYITVTLNHGAIPTRYSPPIPYPNLGERINLFVWKLSEKIISRALLPLINNLRKKVGLKSVNSYRDVWESPLCNLIAISPALCRPRDDWENNQKICGFFKRIS
jgi:UDP:flavonoid glycosyltransferase YjiC (YdhE family)